MQVDGKLALSKREDCRLAVQAVNRVIFGLCLFDGNVDDFYSPESNCVNRVLEFKLGSPAALVR